MIRPKLNFWPLLPVVILLIALVASRLIGGSAENQAQKEILPDGLPDGAACVCCLETE